MLPMRPECSQMISAPYPGRLPGEGGGLLLSQQLGHLVLFLQRMPHELSWRRSMPPSPRRRTASRQARRAPWPSGGGRGVATAPLHEAPGARQASAAATAVVGPKVFPLTDAAISSRSTPTGSASRITGWFVRSATCTLKADTMQCGTPSVEHFH